jgi:hypothetical protein
MAGRPGSAGIMEIERKAKSNASGILTPKQCRALQQCERHGLADPKEQICEDLDGHGLEIDAQQCSPKLEARPLDLSSRDKPTDVARRREFELEE